MVKYYILKNARIQKGEMMKYEKVTVFVPKDAVMTCDKGFLLVDPLNNEEHYITDEVKVMGNGFMEAVGEKKKVNGSWNND